MKKIKLNKNEIRKILNKNMNFEACFSRFGSVRGSKSYNTILLLDITDDKGNIILDHTWITLTNGMMQINLKPGDRVLLNGKLSLYTKTGNEVGYDYDFEIKDITGFMKKKKMHEGIVRLS